MSELQVSAEEQISATLNGRAGHLIRRLHQVATATFAKRARDFDLTPLQYVVLQILEACPGIDQTGLTRLASTDRQTISIVVRKLAEKGLIRRGQHNGRQNALSLTGAGRASAQAMRLCLVDVEAETLDPLSADERQTLIGLIRKVVTAAHPADPDLSSL